MSAGKRKSEKAVEWTLRPCLKCDDKFKSRNKFVRVCDKCKESPEWTSPLLYQREKLT